MIDYVTEQFVSRISEQELKRVFHIEIIQARLTASDKPTQLMLEDNKYFTWERAEVGEDLQYLAVYADGKPDEDGKPYEYVIGGGDRQTATALAKAWAADKTKVLTADANGVFTIPMEEFLDS